MKKFISLLISLSIVFTLSIPAFSAENTFDTNHRIMSIGKYITQDGQAFQNKVESIFPYFVLDKNYKLSVTLTDEELTSTYNFTVNDIKQLNNLLDFQSDSIDGAYTPRKSPIHVSERLHVSDWKIYFSNDDIYAFLFAAAQVGPAAIIAALSALGSIYPGVGTVIGAFIGLFGASSIIYMVFQAVALKKGLYIGVDWNGPFPNPALGLW